MKKAKKKNPKKAWLIASSIVLVFVLVFNILAMTMFFDLIGGFLGRKVPVYADGIESMYPALNSSNKAEAFRNANDKNIEVCEEGFVLLKNNDKALPLAKGSKISVFGKNSVKLSYGGSGSSAFQNVTYKTLDESLTEAGFKTNQTLREFYLDNSKSGNGRSANSSDLDSGDNQIIAVGETPVAKYIADRVLTLPLYADLPLEDVDRICDIILA